MNLANQFINFFKSRGPKPFVIYEIGALSATTDAELSQFNALEFDSAYKYGYRNEVKIPYQPLEDGKFSTDSILDTPFSLKVTGAITMVFSDSVDADFNGIENTVSSLLEYLQNDTQLVIFKKQPFFTTYVPMHLKEFDFDVSPDNITLYADMVFQQVRSATSGSVVYGQPNLSNQNNLTNPTNSNIVDDGNVAPNNNPSASSTLIQSN